MKKNSWVALASVAALIYMLMPVADGLAQERLDLEPGETNWIEPKFEEGTTAVITTQSFTQGLTPLQMVQELLNTTFPDPVLSVQNIVWTGNPSALGIFANAMMPIGLDHGAIVSTGNIWSVIGGVAFPWNTAPNVSTNWGLPGDARISANCGFPTYDAATLKFEIKSTIPQLLMFRYVFGSEEYTEWCGSVYMDGFKILIDGINVALIPPVLGAPPVCIWSTCPPSPWYLDNALSNRETELDGLTQRPGAPAGGPGEPVMSLPFLMTADSLHTVEIIIADGSDHVWDSDAFVKASFDPDTLLGACAFPGGACVVTSDSLCTAAGGIFLGGSCPDTTTGACCTGEGCFELTEALCDSIGGSYEGDFTTCLPLGACEVGDTCYVTSEDCCPGTWQEGTVCPNPPPKKIVPTLNQWGMLVLLFLLAGCAIIIVRRRQATAH